MSVEQLPNTLSPDASITVHVCQLRHVELPAITLDHMVGTSGGGSERLLDGFRSYTVITALELTSVSPVCNGLGAQPSMRGLAASLRHAPSWRQLIENLENLGHTIPKLSGDLICGGLGRPEHVGHEYPCPPW